MGHGGKRPNAGRKNGARTEAQKQAIDIAGQVLDEIDAKKHWKALLTCGDNKVIKDVMIYLTNRRHGMPVQATENKHEGDLLISWLKEAL